MKVDLPDTVTLGSCLASLFNAEGTRFLKILSRQKAWQGGTFPAELVWCELSNGNRLHLRIKYAHGLDGINNRFGHRSGVEYEAKIYEYILSKLPHYLPLFYGYCHVPEGHLKMLVLENLDNGIQIKYHDPNAYSKAAAWIGNFHRDFESCSFDFVISFDAPYYTFWADRLEQLSGNAREQFPWLLELCIWYRQHIHLLTECPMTLIHGEYYTKNILIQGNTICPVDWETAALAAGEVDLAGLIDGKDAEAAELAIANYKDGRWGKAVPEGFEERLLEAQLYFKFRWIAEWVNTVEELQTWLKNKTFGKKLLELAAKAGVVPVMLNQE